MGESRPTQCHCCPSLSTSPALVFRKRKKACFLQEEENFRSDKVSPIRSSPYWDEKGSGAAMIYNSKEKGIGTPPSQTHRSAGKSRQLVAPFPQVGKLSLVSKKLFCSVSFP